MQVLRLREYWRLEWKENGKDARYVNSYKSSDQILKLCGNPSCTAYPYLRKFTWCSVTPTQIRSSHPGAPNPKT